MAKWTSKKREGLQKKKSNSNRLWEILDDIKLHKKGNLLDYEAYLRDFNTFIALRALAMDADLLPFTNAVNEFCGSLDKKQTYQLLVKLIPKTDYRAPWIKNEKTDNPTVDAIMEFYECNRREAFMYYDMFGEKWAEEIERKFGGLRD